jgi:hypothetical protein
MVFLYTSLATSPGHADTLALTPSTPSSEPSAPPYLTATSIVSGVAFGALMGWAIGMVLPKESSCEMWANGLGGGVLGMSFFPFVNYEYTARRYGFLHPDNSWTLGLGTAATNTNHERTRQRTTPSAMLFRHYTVNDHFDLTGILSATRRSFTLEEQTILPSGSYVENRDPDLYDIRYDVIYVDVALLSRMHLQPEAFTLSFGLGPMFSVPVYDITDFHQIRSVAEREQNIDFYRLIDEPSVPISYLGVCGSVGLEYQQIVAQLFYQTAIRPTGRIYPLDDETRLTTLILSLGYRFD